MFGCGLKDIANESDVFSDVSPFYKACLIWVY